MLIDPMRKLAELWYRFTQQDPPGDPPISQTVEILDVAMRPESHEVYNPAQLDVEGALERLFEMHDEVAKFLATYQERDRNGFMADEEETLEKALEHCPSKPNRKRVVSNLRSIPQAPRRMAMFSTLTSIATEYPICLTDVMAIAKRLGVEVCPWMPTSKDEVVG
jgi:hypothetical protein